MSEHAEQVRRLLDECERLREENAQLRAVLASHDLLPKPAIEVSQPAPNETGTVTNSSPPEKKLALFRSLFRGREDVYAVRWEKGEKSGYSPAGIMDWRAILSAKLADRKKVARQTRSLSVLTDQAIREHLEGKSTVGIYPLLPDETCWFLAADFDKSAWRQDAAAFLETCRCFGVPASLERSRSGNGGHAWLFRKPRESWVIACSSTRRSKRIRTNGGT